jgi:hypothetical protein
LAARIAITTNATPSQRHARSRCIKLTEAPAAWLVGAFTDTCLG